MKFIKYLDYLMLILSAVLFVANLIFLIFPSIGVKGNWFAFAAFALVFAFYFNKRFIKK